jgi:hypothetical protein
VGDTGDAGAAGDAGARGIRIASACQTCRAEYAHLDTEILSAFLRGRLLADVNLCAVRQRLAPEELARMRVIGGLLPERNGGIRVIADPLPQHDRLSLCKPVSKVRLISPGPIAQIDELILPAQHMHMRLCALFSLQAHYCVLRRGWRRRGQSRQGLRRGWRRRGRSRLGRYRQGRRNLGQRR